MKRRSSQGQRDAQGSHGRTDVAGAGPIASGEKRSMGESEIAPSETLLTEATDGGVQHDHGQDGGSDSELLPGAMKRYDSVCTICGASNFLPFGQRSDGIHVLKCAVCGQVRKLTAKLRVTRAKREVHPFPSPKSRNERRPKGETDHEQYDSRDKWTFC